MNGRGAGNGMGPGQSLVFDGLKRLSTGWVDREMVTLRKMAKDGATAEEIGAAIGISGNAAKTRIRRLGLVWNNKRAPERHLLQSAAAIGTHMKLGHGKWHEEATRLRGEGRTNKQISARIGVSASTIGKFFERHKIAAPARLAEERSRIAKERWQRRVEKYGPSGSLNPRAARTKAPKAPKAPRVLGKVDVRRMLALVVRLHAEGTLTEEQTAEATGLSRQIVRSLVEAA